MRKPTPKVVAPPKGAVEVWEVFITPPGVRGTSNFVHREVIFIGAKDKAEKIQAEGGPRCHITRRFAVVLKGRLHLLATLNPTTYFNPKTSRWVHPTIESNGHDNNQADPHGSGTA